MNPFVIILLVNASCTFALVGLIWTIQVVHYPAFRFIDKAQFQTFERFHQRSISMVVMPLMLVELLTSGALMIWATPTVPGWTTFAGAILVGVIWLCTITVQAPLHNRLLKEYNLVTINRLVIGNWIRTILWSLRGALMIWMLCRTWRPE